MKTICFIGVCIIAFGCVGCQSIAPCQQVNHMSVRTTAYTHSEADHIKYGRKAAANTKLKAELNYTSAASDWSFLPVGTTFTIKGDKHRYIIDDYGSALVGTQTIDIYRPSRSLMNSWGVKIVDISIERVGDYNKSLAILQDRTKYNHVRQMLQGIKQNMGQQQRRVYSWATTRVESPVAGEQNHYDRNTINRIKHSDG